MSESRFLAILLDRGRPYPLIVAHRGDSSLAPENTLEAARLGWVAGADAWELDVQLTRDGIPVVLHDESLARTTDVAYQYGDDPRSAAGYRVADFDLREIRGLNAGSWFVDPADPNRSAGRFGTTGELSLDQLDRYRSGEVKVPTLADALALTVDYDWLVNVELKSFPNTRPDLLEAVFGVIDETDCASRVLLSSFDHADVLRAARLRPDIATGALAATPLARPHDYVRDLVGADCYHPSAEVLGAASDAYVRAPSPATLRSSDLAVLRERGIPVLVYTVNQAHAGGLAEHLAEAGVAGLFTDYPARMRRLFRGW